MKEEIMALRKYLVRYSTMTDMIQMSVVRKMMAPVLKQAAEAEAPLLNINPDNIFVNEDTKEVGFGLRPEKIKEQSQNYMSPEQIVGKGDRSSDVYALAATFYYCLCGATVPAANERKIAGDRDLEFNLSKADLNDDERKAIIKGLSLNAEERFADAAAFAAALGI